MEGEAGWLSPEVLLALIRSAVPEPIGVQIVGDVDVAPEAHRLVCDRLTLVLIRFAAPPSNRRPAVLSIRMGRHEARLDLAAAAPDLRPLCRDALAGLDADARARVIAFLTTALGWPQPPSSRIALSRSLLLARDALRERLPYAVPAADTAFWVRAEPVVAIDERTFGFTGTMTDPGGPLASVTAVAPEGVRADLLPRLCRRAGRLPHEAGFAGSCVLDAPSVLDEGWRLEWRTGAGEGLEVQAPRVVRDLAGARRVLLTGLSGDGDSRTSLIRDLLFPNLDRLHARLRTEAVVENLVQYGTPAASPDASIVVACGERADLLEHQLAQFAHDPDILAADIVYIDHACISPGLAERAAHLHELYRVPFRLATLSCAAGFAAAVDAGAALGRAPLLVVLAPDALPARPGWRPLLAACLGGTPGAGAAVPSVAPIDVPACGSEVPPEAACLMIERALLAHMGGLSGRYVQADSEVNDLCLRLGRAGRGVAVCPEAAFHMPREHLPGGSLRADEACFDRWVQEYLHGTPAG